MSALHTTPVTAARSPLRADTALTHMFAGALNHVLRYLLTGCNHSAHHAIYLLDHLAEHPDVGCDLRAMCERMSGSLADRCVITERWSH